MARQKVKKQCKQCSKPITRRTFCSKKCSAIFRFSNYNLIDKNDLKQLYEVQKLGLANIATKYSCSINTVCKYLKKHKIKKRIYYEDLTGQILGNIKIIKPIKITNAGHITTVWLCKCLLCNKIYKGTNNVLKNCKTQRCLECAKKLKRSKEEFKYYLYKQIERRAKDNKLEINVNHKYLYNLFLKQDRKCALTGIDIKFTETSKKLKETTASLDRIDSSKGYIKGNVQWVHKDINKMKLDFTQENFVKYCYLVIKKLGNEYNLPNFS